MFRKLRKEIKSLERGLEFSVTLPLDEAVYFDRQCQYEECNAEFKVLGDDWREKVSDDVVFCPVCRREDAATNWNT